jgi:hypothetical protein
MPVCLLVIGQYRKTAQEGFMDKIGRAAEAPEFLGKKTWVIAEGYIPGESNGPEPQMTSHETACILNTGNKPANLEIYLYFTNRDPVGPYEIIVPAQRTLHLRFNDLEEPEPVPRDTDYASVIQADVPVVVQHTRLDSRQSANALLTTVAYGAER